MVNLQNEVQGGVDQDLEHKSDLYLSEGMLRSNRPPYKNQCLCVRVLYVYGNSCQSVIGQALVLVAAGSVAAGSASFISSNIDHSECSVEYRDTMCE